MYTIDLPKGWALSTLPESIAIDGLISDGDWVESKDQNPNGSIRLIQLADIGDGDFKNRSERFMSPDRAEALNCTYLEPGDVLIARMPEPLGRACLFPDIGQDAVTVVDICLIRTGKKTAIINKLLMYWINSPVIRNLIYANSSGTTRTRITRKKLELFEFPIPPLAEQKVIADKLSILLAQVEMTKARFTQILENLKTLRQSIITAAVSGKLTEEWRAVNGFISNKWDQVVAADVCLKITDGEHQTPKRQVQGRMLLTAKNIRDGFIDYEDHDLISEEDFNKCLKRCNAEINDVLIVSVGATIGRAAIKKDDIEFALVRSVGLFKIDPEKIIGDYLLYSLQSQKVQNFISESSRGNAQSTLYIKAMSAIPITLPPLAEQKEIVHRVEEVIAFSKGIEQKVKVILDRINNLSQSILAKAFHGELTADWRITNHELISSDNSAEALLARIRVEREKIDKQPKLKKTSVKKKADSRMSKKIIRVSEALKQAGKPLNGQQLLAAAGYPLDSSTDQLEQFFLDVRSSLAIEKSIIKLERDGNSQDWFMLAQDSQK
ncbi:MULTISPECIES: restriction endonuclease subunit S [unclassified Acinetobacter]|uniref:restriction endonuclease subunit S n=1 Tax=unclassified Acinetobacter TaxID=196816 RepID=UPI00051C0F2D|nr:restriction endonuclease subunit S [Acinetobacter sp. MN12]